MLNIAKRLGSAILLATCLSNPVYAQSISAATTYIRTNDIDIKLISITEKEDNKTLPYTIKVIYPKLIDNKNAANAEKFNHAIKSIVDTMTAQFKKTVTAQMADQKTLPADIQRNTLYSGYQTQLVQFNDTAIVGINMDIETMYAGMAHPAHDIAVLNFNLTTGKKLALADLFKPGTSYLQKLSDACMQKLTMARKDNPYIFDDATLKKATAPLEKNYRNWNLSTNGIVILFTHAEVAASAAGTQKVVIPFASMRDVINQDLIKI